MDGEHRRHLEAGREHGPERLFLLFPSKNLGGIGDGGMVTTSDPTFADIVRSNPQPPPSPEVLPLSRVGGNFRLQSIQAAVLGQARCLESWHAARRRNADRYRQLFGQAGLVGDPVTLQAVYAHVEGADRHNHHIYNQFVILVPRRDELRQFLQDNGVGCEIYYRALPAPANATKDLRRTFRQRHCPGGRAGRGHSWRCPFTRN